MITVAENYDDLCHRGAKHFVETVGAAVTRDGHAAVALSGGSTPKALYALLAQAPYRDQVAWDKVHIFWGDERSVPPDDSQSNYRMAHEALLEHVPVPAGNVHRMVAEAADKDASADAYAAEIRRVVANERFTLIHLGMGDDGHTLSLFPHTAALDVTDRLVVPNRVDKLDTWRMTFTYPLANAAEHVVFLVSGDGKAAVLKQVLEGPRDHHTHPSQGIQPVNGTLTWLVDRAAAALLTSAPTGGR
ncbi:MAG: 6-phosphogluconolactonase [Armatimonadetes bacterium]|nr:6-phosphogluconolactonase [Armatimonadota bacterium]